MKLDRRIQAQVVAWVNDVVGYDSDYGVDFDHIGGSLRAHTEIEDKLKELLPCKRRKDYLIVAHTYIEWVKLREICCEDEADGLLELGNTDEVIVEVNKMKYLAKTLKLLAEESSEKCIQTFLNGDIEEREDFLKSLTSYNGHQNLAELLKLLDKEHNQ